MNDDEKPTMTEQELWEWLHYDEGIPVSRRAIKHAVIDRKIKPTRFGNNNYFSKTRRMGFCRRAETTYCDQICRAQYRPQSEFCCNESVNAVHPDLLPWRARKPG